MFFGLDFIPQLAIKRKQRLDVRLPMPGAYLVKKALFSQKKTNAEKRDKDLAYIYDIATSTYGRWPELRAEIEELHNGRVAPSQPCD